MLEEGTLAGEICNRNGCTGLIVEEDTDESCSCHINPPCSYCVNDRHYCPVCDWSGREDQRKADNERSKNITPFVFKVRTLADLNPEKIDYIVRSHTHFTQICEGVYPETATIKDVEQKVKGSFGGRFEHFGNGKFKYIAYTD